MKKVSILITLLFVISVAAACADKNTEQSEPASDTAANDSAVEIPLTVPDSDDLPAEIPVVSEDAIMSLTINTTTYPVGTETIYIDINNESEEDYGGYGYHYSIEYKKGDHWEPVDITFAVIEPYIFLGPGESHTLTINLYPDQYDYVPGLYRVVKYENNQELTVEFTLEEN